MSLKSLENDNVNLAKMCHKLERENAELRKIRTDLIPNEWTLEYFKGLCDIKMPEGAMVSGEQLLELLKDKERLDWMADEGFDTREQIDEAMKGQL